jgi:hypothetical protein
MRWEARGMVGSQMSYSGLVLEGRSGRASAAPPSATRSRACSASWSGANSARLGRVGHILLSFVPEPLVGGTGAEITPEDNTCLFQQR